MKKFAVLSLLILAAHVGAAFSQEMLETTMVDRQLTPYGIFEIWNDQVYVNVVITQYPGFLFDRCYLNIDEGLPFLSSLGNPVLGKFNYGTVWDTPTSEPYRLAASLIELGFPTDVKVAAYCVLESTTGNSARRIGVWAWGENQFPGPVGGYWFEYDIIYR